MPLDAGDRGPGKRVEPAEELGQAFGVAQVVLEGRHARGAHLGNVGAGAEGAAFALEDDDAGRRIGGDRLERRAQLLEHALGKRVALGRAAESETPHGALGTQKKRRATIRHRKISLYTRLPP